ncbi:MAG: hemerythrin domain-containing protein [Myxococcales bacterium]
MGRAASGGSVDALDLLKAQHREVEGLFKQFERAGNDENNQKCFEVAQVICQKLTVHATIEEEILYPLARAKGEQSEEEELKDKVLEALEEHLSAKRLIADIQALEAGDERLGAKICVLKEQVSHHVDEEEDEMFPQIKKELSKDERRTLGQQLKQRTGELEMNVDSEGAQRQPESPTKSQPGNEWDTEEASRDRANGATMANGTTTDVGAQRSSGGRQPSRSNTTHHSHH